MHRDSCGRRRCFEWAVGLRMLVRPGTPHQSHSHCAVFCTACRTNILAAALLGCGAAEVHEREPCGRECGVVGCVVRGRYQHREKSGTVVDRTSRNHDAMGKWICRCMARGRPATALGRVEPLRTAQANSDWTGLPRPATVTRPRAVFCCLAGSSTGWARPRLCVKRGCGVDFWSK